MKNVFFSLAFMLIGSFAFANTKEVKPVTNVVTKEVFVKSENKKTEEDKKNSCSVTVKFGNSTVTITNSCDCSQTAACDGAYAIARLATML